MIRKYMPDTERYKKTIFKEGPYKSIREAVSRVARLLPNDNILAELDAQKNIKYFTCKQIYDEAMNLGTGLIKMGLQGKHIAIVSNNCCRYVICDISISSGVGVSVPIDRDAPESLLALLLNKCDADAVMCSADKVNILRSLQESACPKLSTIITLDHKVEGLSFYDEVVSYGESVKDDTIFKDIQIDLDAPAKILFTSGTTGTNKGVVLTNRNLATNIMNCLSSVSVTAGNTSMSVLPMHHAAEINTHIMARLTAGKLTYICSSMRNMMAEFKIFKPTITTIVPIIANAFYRNIWANAEKQGKADKLRKGIRISNFLRKFGINITHKIFTDIYESFGGNLDTIICGAAMLNSVVVKGLNDIGIRLHNGYGITECGPLISMNTDTLKDPLSVGKACSGLEVIIKDPDENGVGDLCVRGASVSLGYYKDEEATKAVFGEDGFFNTGDCARIDSEGKIFLLGRKKNTIVLQNGKNVNPEEIENVLSTNMDFAQDVVVYQAKYNNIDLMCVGLYIEETEIRHNRDFVIDCVKKVNVTLPNYKRIEYIEFPDAPYEKTSTRKIKRGTLPRECSGNGALI